MAGCRARFPEQQQPSKASSGLQKWLRQSCFEFRLAAISRSRRRAQSGAPLSGNSLSSSRREGSSSNCRAATAPSEPAGFRAHPAFRISRRIFAFEDLLTRGARKSGSEDRRSGEFGESNALTLRKWRRRFLEKWPQVEWLGFDAPFRRLWEYYLCYCEAGFRSGMIDVGLYSIQHRRA